MKIRAAGAAWPGLVLAAMLAMSAPIQAQTTAVATAAPITAAASRPLAWFPHCQTSVQGAAH